MPLPGDCQRSGRIVSRLYSGGCQRSAGRSSLEYNLLCQAVPRRRNTGCRSNAPSRMPDIGAAMPSMPLPGGGRVPMGPGPSRLRRPEPATAVSAHAGDGPSRFRPPGGEATPTAHDRTNAHWPRVRVVRPVGACQPRRGDRNRPSLVAACAAANRHVRSSVSCASVSRVLGRSTLRVLRTLRPR